VRRITPGVLRRPALGAMVSAAFRTPAGRIYPDLWAIYIPERMVLRPVQLTAPVTVPMLVPACICCVAKKGSGSRRFGS